MMRRVIGAVVVVISMLAATSPAHADWGFPNTRNEGECYSTPEGPTFTSTAVADTGDGLVVVAADNDPAGWLGTLDATTLEGAVTARQGLLRPTAIAGGGGRALVLGFPPASLTPGATHLQIVPAGGATIPPPVDLAIVAGAEGASTVAAVAYRDGAFLIAHDERLASGEIAIRLTRVAPDGTRVESTRLATVANALRGTLASVAIAVGGEHTYVAWEIEAEAHLVRLDAAALVVDDRPIERELLHVKGLAADADGAVVLLSYFAMTELRRFPVDAVAPDESWSVALPADAFAASPVVWGGRAGVVFTSGDVTWVYTYGASSDEPEPTWIGPGQGVSAVVADGALVVIGVVQTSSDGYSSTVTVRRVGSPAGEVTVENLARLEGDLGGCGGCTVTPVGRAAGRAGPAVFIVLALALAGSGALRRR